MFVMSLFLYFEVLRRNTLRYCTLRAPPILPVELIWLESAAVYRNLPMTQAAEILPLTFAEFLEWEKGQALRHEYLHGEVHAMTGTTDRHNTISLNLAFLLREHLRNSPCRVYMADVMLRVEAADAGFYPDLMVTCSEQDRDDRYVKREPVLIIEVLSETTAAFDLGEKFAAYRQLQDLKEYVLVDPERERVQAFRPDADGRWVLYPTGPGDTLLLESVGLEIPVGEVYRE